MAKNNDNKAGNTLVVYGESGIAEVRTDGSVVQTLSKTGVSAARFDAQHRRIFFVTATNDELKEITVADRKERTVARLPKSVTSCKATPDYKRGHQFALSELAITSVEDFALDQSEAFVCVSLKDRNLNMMNVDVAVRAEISTGAVRVAMVFPECGKQPTPTCRAASQPRPTSTTNETQWPYRIEGGKLIKGSGAAEKVIAALGTGDFAEDLSGPSPSGRWIAIRGNQTDGDYIHFDLYLFDRNSGEIWPIRTAAVAAIPAAQLPTLAADKFETVDVVGETSVSWLPNQEILVIDDKVVRPGAAAVVLPGRVLGESRR